jgi:DNA-directed RNA polymerase alpha subunit
MSNQTTIRSLLPKVGNPALNALENIGITTIHQLTKMTEKETLKIHGVGPKAVSVIKEAMKKDGISFKKDK